ncbi:MAG: hypothetical protein R3183_14570, partial [Oleiphilaceae bacterium]|nr:hypothetical protein [Oleiphilaceae bacterium]
MSYQHANDALSGLMNASHRPLHAPDMKQWYHAFCGLTQSQTLAFDRATLGGVTSQCVAFAFVAGYQSA